MGFFTRYEEKYDNVIRETDPNEHPLNLLSYMTVGFSVDICLTCEAHISAPPLPFLFHTTH
jgi:hypothetical protein